MGKKPSMITVAKIGSGYSVDARGAFGGGWTRRANSDELSSTIIRAWQMYGDNPLGCEIVGDMPENVQQLADKLTSGGSEKSVITIRVSRPEAILIKQMAESENKSVNQFVVDKIFG